MSGLISKDSVLTLIESKCVDGCLAAGDITLIDAYGLLDDVADIEDVSLQEIRDKAIEEALEKSAKAICIGCGYLNGHECTYNGANCGVSKPMLEAVTKALEQMKEVGE